MGVQPCGLNRIKNLKDTGLSRLPFRAWDANRLWGELVSLAAVLFVALQQLVDDSELRVAEPLRRRYAVLNVAAMIASSSRNRQPAPSAPRKWS